MPGTPLTPQQVQLLTWVKNGCPEGVYDGTGHRTSARALAAKGLLKVRGHGAEWTVTLTDAGRNWQPGQRRPPRRTAPVTQVAPDPAVLKHRATTEPEPGGKQRAAELVQQVLDAGGRLPIESGYETRRLYEDLVRLSVWAPNRPHGKKLEIVAVGEPWPTRSEVVFTDHFEDLVDLQPVQVPDHISRYSRPVRAYLDDKDWHCVSSAHLSRAARILEAIVREAPSRGLTVDRPDSTSGPKSGRMTPQTAPGLSLTVGDSTFHIQVREISAPGGGPVTRPYYGARRKSPAWTYQRSAAFVSTGRLELVVHGRFTRYAGDVYRDTKTTTVEQKLPRLFQSLEVHRRQAEAAEEERRRRAAEHRRQWEAAMADARARYERHARWEHFTSMSTQWQSIARHRDFLAAARLALAEYEGSDKPEILAQLDMAERTLDELDALHRPGLLMPVVAEPRSDDLKPFLHGWSPNGPDGY